MSGELILNDGARTKSREMMERETRTPEKQRQKLKYLEPWSHLARTIRPRGYVTYLLYTVRPIVVTWAWCIL